MARIIKTQPTIWQELDGDHPMQAVKHFQGYSSLDRFNIDRGFFTGVKNMTSNKDMAVVVRDGYSRLGAVFAGKILGLGAWKNNEIHAVANGTWYKWTGAAWSAALASGLSTSAHWSFTNFKGGFSDINLLAANGVDPIKKYDGAAVSNLANAPAGGNFIEQFADRVWCAIKNQLTGSAWRNAENWSKVSDPPNDADYWYTEVETPNGETISAVKSGLTRLTAYKPNSIHELFGYSPADYILKIVTVDVGAINDRCVATLKNTHFFLHESGPFKYAGGVDPDNSFALPAKDIFDSMNQVGKDTSCVGTDGRRVYFCIPVNQSEYPDTMLEYDPDFGTWYIWEDLKPLHIMSIEEDWYIGDRDGQVLQMGGTTDNGTAISWRAVSVPFGALVSAQNVRWYKMFITAEIPAGSTCNVYLSAKDQGDDDWTLVKSIVGTAGTSKQKIIIPVQTVANANFVRVKFEGTGPAKIYELDYQQRDLPLH